MGMFSKEDDTGYYPDCVEHTKMFIEIKELKDQIEKMKNYLNCKEDYWEKCHYNLTTHDCPCQDWSLKDDV
jgi:hypothetical protein